MRRNPSLPSTSLVSFSNYQLHLFLIFTNCFIIPITFLIIFYLYSCPKMHNLANHNVIVENKETILLFKKSSFQLSKFIEYTILRNNLRYWSTTLFDNFKPMSANLLLLIAFYQIPANTYSEFYLIPISLRLLSFPNISTTVNTTWLIIV